MARERVKRRQCLPHHLITATSQQPGLGSPGRPDILSLISELQRSAAATSPPPPRDDRQCLRYSVDAATNADRRSSGSTCL